MYSVILLNPTILSTSINPYSKITQIILTINIHLIDNLIIHYNCITCIYYNFIIHKNNNLIIHLFIILSYITKSAVSLGFLLLDLMDRMLGHVPGIDKLCKAQPSEHL